MKDGVEFQDKLIGWFQKHQERLPWRQTRDPYKIWVSEIMLQQTTVKTVIPYYHAFLKSFPTLKSLAHAKIEEVLSSWSGLGYYSRARNLHKGAQYVLKECGGRLPESPEALQKIPGIGKYTAGAIASIAFQKPVPLVDGNVLRVYARLFCISKDIKKHQAEFWKLAGRVISQKYPGDFNQGLMELGRRICTPTKPSCPLCPLRSFCQAHLRGQLDAFPKVSRLHRTKRVDLGVALIQNAGEFLMLQRQGSVLRGLWEYPMVSLSSGIFSEKTFRKKIKNCFSLEPKLEKSLPPVKHTIMNQKMTLYPCLCFLPRRPRLRKGWQWVSPERLGELATSSMNKKIMNLLSLNLHG